MTTTLETPVEGAVPGSEPAGRLHRRFRPLYLSVALQGLLMWVPVEKLLMNEIGFTATSVGVMAAAYAAVVPVLEFPTGVLADRWSRREMLVVASIALSVTALIGGLSTNVTMYIVSALVLGVYFACYSGTMESIVYDTVLEETGDGAGFERRIGQVRLVESLAAVGSALLGGWIAELAGPRLTYFLSVPLPLLAVIALLRFREPMLHKVAEPLTLRAHLVVTARTLLRTPRLLPVITMAMLTAVLLQVVFEFGPLWLVAVAVPAALYGPYWAALVGTLGLGGLLAGRLRLDAVAPATLVALAMAGSAAVLSVPMPVAVVIVAQVVLALLAGVAGIHVTQLLHDAVPSTVRSGVASGVSALTWMVFLPVAVVIGVLGDRGGIAQAGVLLFGATVVAGVLLVAMAVRSRSRASTHVAR